jgi:hypothetical protein
MQRRRVRTMRAQVGDGASDAAEHRRQGRGWRRARRRWGPACELEIELVHGEHGSGENGDNGRAN